MCGIFGVYNKNIDRELAERCLNTLIHRGPDDGDIWQNGEITLGHRRLAILDLSPKGRQPMSYLNGRYELVYNGEIFNFLELRRDLRERGYSFESDSDSEVVIAAYDCYGTKCLDKFNGMWAIALWDNKERRLFLSRDRFGVKPLYYTWLEGGGMAFASEMKALFPLMKEIRANRDIVCDPAKTVFYENTEECVIEGILRFPAGCYAYVEEGRIKTKRFWDTLDNLVTPADSYEAQTEEFRELFLDACKLRMRSDVTIGTALSGGLDSSATICAMSHLSVTKPLLESRESKDWQHAFVATFPGTTMDESAYAKQVTDFLGIKSTFVEIDPAKAIDRLDDMIWLFEDVYLTSPIPMMSLYGELRKNGVVVTIDGHGADELFGGYTFDFINALRDARGRTERNMVLDAYIDSFPKDSSNISLKGGRASVYAKFLKRGLIDKLRSKSEGYKKIRAAGKSEYESMDTLNKILYASSHENILPTLLRNYDRYSMANGVEIRMPFMDYRVVSYAMSLPWTSKLHGGYSKSIIRDAMSPYMPKEIAYRKTKIGFNTPIVEWMQGPLKEYFEDMLASKDFKECELIDPEAVRTLVLHVINDRSASFQDGEKAWSSLYPYLWEKNVVKRGACA